MDRERKCGRCVEKTGERLTGHGAVAEAMNKRAARWAEKRGLKLSPVKGNVATGVFVATAVLAYQDARRKMDEIRTLMFHKFQSGEATNEEFNMVFGEIINPEDVKNIGRCNMVKIAITRTKAKIIFVPIVGFVIVALGLYFGGMNPLYFLLSYIFYVAFKFLIGKFFEII